jgi:mannose-1-phosphate guanylyltransferase/mannose-1-phosphate guanylyltransferase/mannose-6-phosphate isomerase
MYVVILAGGGGTRLWPLSSPERPKPFLPLFPEGTLLQKTIARIVGPELGIDRPDITIVAAERYAGLIRDQVPGVGLLSEPEGRNTAPAITLATVAIDRPPDEVMIVLPADHLIRDEAGFRGVLRDAEAGIARGAFGIDDPLVTLGIQTDRPATEYGYLIPRPEAAGVVHDLTAHPLARFEEKPDRARAEELRRRPGVAWNAGMFLWRRRAIRAALEDFAPDVIDPLEPALAARALAAVYPAVRSISIDYAVMEPAAAAGRVVMGAMDVGWSDLGSWTVLLEALGGVGVGRVIQPGETAEAGPDDLVIERIAGRLVLSDGPRGILAETPVALLAEARPGRAVVEALLHRVARQEA